MSRLTMQLAEHARRLLLKVPARDRVAVMEEWTDLLDLMGVIVEDAEIPVEDGVEAWVDAAIAHSDPLDAHLAAMSNPSPLLQATTWDQMARAMTEI